MEKRVEFKALFGLITTLLIAWLCWVSNAIVSLQESVAVLQYKDFGKVSRREEPLGPNLESDMNFFEFLERRK